MGAFMSPDLGKLPVERKSGKERDCMCTTQWFKQGRTNLGFDLLSFWRWIGSDLVSNSMRGVLAEYLGARALGLYVDGIRSEWDACDLVMPGGLKIEVKSAAYIQTWPQKELSKISFLVRRTKGWDAN